MKLLSFVLSWVTYAFALVTVGTVSVTVAVATGAVSLVHYLRPTRSMVVVAVMLMASALWGTVVAGLSGVPASRTGSHLGQSVLALGFVALGRRAGPPSAHQLRRVVLPIVGLIVVFAWYQVPARRLELQGDFLPITNEQVTGDEGRQRGYSSGTEFTRASSIFPEPSDLGRFGAWTLLLALMGPAPRVLRLSLIMLALGAVMAAQSLGGILASLLVVGLWVASKARPRRRLAFKRSAWGVLLVPLLLGLTAYAGVQLGFVEPVASRLAGFVSGESALERTARFADLAFLVQSIAARPIIGHGLGSVGTLPGDLVVSSSYVVLLFERGLGGTLLFLAPAFGVLGTRFRSRGAPSLDFPGAWVVLELFLFLNFAMIYFPTYYYALGVASDRRSTRGGAEA